jgi:Na+-transporting NADH:ubiquinone oxidoreductase subunit A
MPDVIKIRRGLDIKLLGEASKKISKISPEMYAIDPPDFIGVFPKLMVTEGETVKAGSPLFIDKYRDNIIFTSPVSGKISEIHRGEKRKILEVRIIPDNKTEYEFFEIDDPAKISKEEIRDKLLKSGVWSYIRQRPYSVIANPKDDPKAIFISAFDSAPLAPDYNFIIENQEKAFHTGLNALMKLTTGKVHLSTRSGQNIAGTFLNAKGVTQHHFVGPHPAGNVGIQIHHIDPINKGDVVWFVNPQAVVTIGKLFLEGRYDATRIIALTGSEIKNPQYYEVICGCQLSQLFKDNLNSIDVRFINGNVLTGGKVDKNGYLSFYDYQVTVIPEGNYHEFLGWALPRLKKFSFSKSFFSWLTPSKKYRLDTNLNGGRRAFVLTGHYEKVFPMDIYPMQLLKAIMIRDIDQMENLGIYEVDEEDFALCEYIDASKTDLQAIVREGLNFIRKEMAG